MIPQSLRNLLRGAALINTEGRVEHLHVIHEEVHAQITALRSDIVQLSLRRDRHPRLGDLLCEGALIDRNLFAEGQLDRTQVRALRRRYLYAQRARSTRSTGGGIRG